MVRVLDDLQLRFLNRREWREVAAAVQASVTLPNIVEALREGARRLKAPEQADACAGATGGLQPSGY